MLRTISFTEPAPNDSLRPAGFWIRAVARGVDWFILALIGIPVTFFKAFIAGVMGLTEQPAVMGNAGGITFLGWVGSALATLGYYFAFEGIAGSTVGKRVTGLQVISFDQRPIRFVQAVKRSLAFFVDALFFGIIAAQVMSDSVEKQRVGDKWAGTRVVMRRTLPLTLLTTRGVMITAFITATVLAFEILVVFEYLEYVART